MVSETTHGPRFYMDNFHDLVDALVEQLPQTVGGQALRVQLYDGVDGSLVNSDGSLPVAFTGSAYYDGGVALTPAYAFANVAASQTDSSIVTATAAKVIRVLQVAFVAGATATNITFNTKPTGAGSAISPLFADAGNGGVVLPYSPVGWFETGSGEGLTVTTGAGATTGILVTYVKR